MINQAEAERIALRHINPNSPIGEGDLEITQVIEKRYGWIFCYNGRGGVQYDGNVPVVVERDSGAIRGLYSSAVDLETNLRWFEAEWLWRSQYAEALECAKQGKFEEAEQRLQKCLSTAKDSVLDRWDNHGNVLTIPLELKCRNSLGEVQLKTGNLTSAEASLLAAKSQLDQYSPVKQVAMLEHRLPILQNLIALRHAQKRNRDADIIKREIATAHRTAREHIKAQEVLEQQLQKRTELYPQGHPAVAQTLTDLAALKADLTQFFEAQIFLEAAMKIWEPLLQDPDKLKKHAEAATIFPMHELLESGAETMDCYASYVLMREGKRDEAVALRQRAKQLLELK